MSTSSLMIMIILIKSSSGRIEDCFRKDPISCLQLPFNKTSIEYLTRPIEIGGFTLQDNDDRIARNFDEKESEQRITTKRDIAERQNTLGEYFIYRMKYLWNSGSVVGKLLDTIKGLIDSWRPIQGGRGKQQSKFLTPLLVGVMLKFASLAAIFYMVVALIAKKAVIVGVISFLLSSFISVKNLIQTRQDRKYSTSSSPPYQQEQHHNLERINPYQYQQQLQYIQQDFNMTTR